MSWFGAYSLGFHFSPTVSLARAFLELYPGKMDKHTNSRANYHLASSSCVYGTRSSGSTSNHHHLPMINFDQSDGQDHTDGEAQRFYYPNIILRGYIQDHHNYEGTSENHDDIKSKIIAHPQYSNLLQAYMDCQKVGAPAEVVERLTAARQEFEARQTAASRDDSKDPELDQFMEAYYDMLVKYREELMRPLEEAMEFMTRIESQLNVLAAAPLRISGHKSEGVGSPEEDQETEIDPRAQDRELKNHLLKKYSGYISSLKQELSKKNKKAKLPKDARQKLLTWWDLHYKWPYPSESEKVALAESTGLDQKQINNWFINQRKRHWKPSEDMQFMVMDPHNAHFYMGEAPNYRP